MAETSITINSILSPQLTRIKLPGSSKKKVLEEIARTISEIRPDLEEQDTFENLVARERLGSTGIGQGIAIPHSRSDNCDSVLGCLFTLSEKIPFDAIDNEPVDLLFVLLVPQEATSEHLELLSQIAEKFNNPAFCQKLRSANNDQELYEVMTA